MQQNVLLSVASKSGQEVVDSDALGAVVAACVRKANRLEYTQQYRTQHKIRPAEAQQNWPNYYEIRFRLGTLIFRMAWSSAAPNDTKSTSVLWYTQNLGGFQSTGVGVEASGCSKKSPSASSKCSLWNVAL